jgi:ABC-type multidrug transport system fused ATPase/permease subunit
MAVVAQESILFNDTILRNIELGKLGATQEEIIAAAKHAHAYEFIMQKPEGFNTVIGEKGLQGRSTICIAHQLSTVLHADLIVVMDHDRSWRQVGTRS